MKLVRLGLFGYRNLRCLAVRCPVNGICNENIDIIYKKVEVYQSIIRFNHGFSTMFLERKYSNYNVEPTLIPIVCYDEIKDLPNHPEKLLIDVREPQEIIETGKIPTSINIPLGEVVDALSVIPDDKFRKLYGKEKPTKSKYIIFHCLSGKRSAMASESAVKLGFKNVNNYRGSWLDWADHEGLPQ